MSLLDSLLLPCGLEKIMETYAHSREFAERSGQAEKMARLISLYQWISQQFPHTSESLGSGHFFPWVECYEEIRTSCTLCLMGFYKQAMVSLRMGLELGVLSVYWNVDNKGHETIQDWLHSKTDTPWRKKIWKKLNSHTSFQLLREKYAALKGEFDELCGRLDAYVHSKGAGYCNAVGVRTGYKKFEPLGFHAWCAAFERVTKLIMILHLTKYPIGVVKYDWHKKFGIDIPMFGGLESHAVEELEGLIGSDVFAVLQSIAEADEETQRIMRWVQTQPDITDIDIETQMFELAKLEIQMWGGFEAGLDPWLRMRESLYDQTKDFSSAQEKEAHDRVIARILEWAAENGYAYERGGTEDRQK